MPSSCIIVASGQSAKGFVPPDGVTVIAVNGAIDWLSRADYWFTLDPSKENMYRMNHPRAGVKYCAAFRDKSILPAHVRFFERVETVGVEPKKGTPSWWLWRSKGTVGLSLHKDKIHTGNSAYGALGLAYHLGFDKVLLIGVDADNSKRCEGGYSRNLSHLRMLFASALPQIDMVSCGGLDTVRQMTLHDGLAWL